MRVVVAETTLIILGLLCSAPPQPQAAVHGRQHLVAGLADASPADPSVDGDLDGILLRVDDPKPEPATSDRARVAPGPSERKEPAAPEVRQTPVGGQTAGGTTGTPAAPEQDKRRD